MNITLDLTQIYAFFALPMDEQLYRFLLYFGWIPIAVVFIYGAKEIWLDYVQGQFVSKQKFILLAVDIPRGNETSIKAVENMFVYFSGAHGNPNLIEKWWEGKVQLGFSFEIVGIDGYTQFMIRTSDAFRNLVETAVYSQYPDAEITEVDDYTTGIPTKYPDSEYDVWGTEFIYAKNEAYPIRTYKDFEDKAAARPEHLFKDPMASLMDLCATLIPGEQLWYQILINPEKMTDWMDDMNKEVKKILKEKVAVKQGPIGQFFSEVKSWFDEMTEQLFSFSIGSFEQADAKDDGLKMMNLKPQEKKKIEAIQNKISKIGFIAKNRMVYVARKEVKNNPKVVNGFVGYLKQFADLDTNNLRPDSDATQTSTAYFFKDMRLNTRKRKIVSNYRARSMFNGRNPKIMNVEELATLWHFPIEAVVKAPLIQKAPGRKAEPPMSLPLGDFGSDKSSVFMDDLFGDISEKEKTGARNSISSEADEIFRIEDGGGGKKIIKTESPENKGKPPVNLPF